MEPVQTSTAAMHLEEPPPGARFTWKQQPMVVRAVALRRNMWLRASIDVFLGNRAVLRTGGKPWATGTVEEVFHFDGGEHRASVHWEQAVPSGFPVVVQLDGETVFQGVLPVDGGAMPAVLALALGVGAALMAVLLR